MNKELFAIEANSAPKSVKREKCFSVEEEAKRRADILLYYEDIGVSIEVKLDDLHYAKTSHTASLIEDTDQRNWRHFLLLPKSHKSDLKSVLGDMLEEKTDHQLIIRSEKYCDIEVLYWKNVSRALRRTILFHDNKLDPHWEASAYLFIALIEQKVCDLYSQPFVERNFVESGEATYSDIQRIRSIEVDSQLKYLSEFAGG
ncbi:hypothetical protein KGY77_08510 [Candidatus Bipolaricaulota bacterium]|nr:hypothetical protein [Candidatus Bipolaricaulota bacterium]